jgi:DNA primase
VSWQKTAAHIDTAALKRERPLADVVAAYGIPLRPQGIGRFWALCPFHAERTPSFCVDVRDPEVSHYHCFACQAHGDVIDFVRQRENCSFVEACERLGARDRPPAHHPVSPRAARNSGRRWDLLPADSVEGRVLELAARIFSRTLSEHARARDYLIRRGVSSELAHRQRLGFADGRSFLQALRQSAGDAEDGGSLVALAEAMGLVTRRPDDGIHYGYREFFFDRLMIPELRDGRPIWFIGRAIEEPAEPGADASGRRRPKYLSLPGERPILGLEHAVGRQTAYLVEGPFDLLAAIGWGLPAFAICGTHVPPERLPTLGGAVAIYGVFDSDRAGQSAAERFAPLMGAKWRPVQLPNGMDLAELAARGQPGRDLFEALVGRARAAAWRTGRP